MAKGALLHVPECSDSVLPFPSKSRCPLCGMLGCFLPLVWARSGQGIPPGRDHRIKQVTVCSEDMETHLGSLGRESQLERQGPNPQSGSIHRNGETEIDLLYLEDGAPSKMNQTPGEHEDSYKGLLIPETKISFQCQIGVTSYEPVSFDSDKELRLLGNSSWEVWRQSQLPRKRVVGTKGRN